MFINAVGWSYLTFLRDIVKAAWRFKFGQAPFITLYFKQQMLYPVIGHEFSVIENPN